MLAKNGGDLCEKKVRMNENTKSSTCNVEERSRKLHKIFKQ